MTEPTIDLAGLRAKAEAAREAAPEEWGMWSYEGGRVVPEQNRGGMTVPAHEVHKFSLCSSNDLRMTGDVGSERHTCVATVHSRAESDTRLVDFMALANPSAVLSLLNSLEAVRVAVERARDDQGGAHNVEEMCSVLMTLIEELEKA